MYVLDRGVRYNIANLEPYPLPVDIGLTIYLCIHPHPLALYVRLPDISPLAAKPYNVLLLPREIQIPNLCGACYRETRTRINLAIYPSVPLVGPLSMLVVEAKL